MSEQLGIVYKSSMDDAGAALREQLGVSTKFEPDEFGAAIRSISGGTSAEYSCIDPSLLPYSDSTKVLASQTDEMFSDSNNVWGVFHTTNTDPRTGHGQWIQKTQDGIRNSTYLLYDLGYANQNVTVYGICKKTAALAGDVGVLSANFAIYAGVSPMFYSRGFELYTSVYADDTDTGINLSDGYAVLAFSLNDQTKKIRFYVNGAFFMEKTYDSSGSLITINSFNNVINTCAFKFAGIVNECETDSAIINNMNYLAGRLLS